MNDYLTYTMNYMNDNAISSLWNGPFQTCVYDTMYPRNGDPYLCFGPYAYFDTMYGSAFWRESGGFADWDDRISSMTHERLDGVYFYDYWDPYDGDNYRAQCDLSAGGTCEFPSAADEDDKVVNARSLIIGECIELTVYDEENFQGNSFVFSQTEEATYPYLKDWDEKIQSFKMKRRCDPIGKDLYPPSY